MDILYEMQCELQRFITNSFANFKKKGVEKMNRCSAQVRLKGLEDYYAQFKNNHVKILTSAEVPRDHVYFTANLLEIVTDTYYDRKGEFMSYVEQELQQERERNPSPTDVAVNPLVQTKHVDQHSLPKIDLPKFSGAFSEWENFRDLFRSVVHRRADMDALLKFYYLRSNLTDEATERIKSIPISGENYERAWKSLVDYYENKRRIVHTHISSILSVKPMKSESSFELKRVFREVFNPLESLTVIGRTNSDIGNDLVVHLAVEQFDNETKKDWKKSLEKNDTPPTITQLKVFIESQIETLESIEGKRSKSSSTVSIQKSKMIKNDSHSTSAHTLQISTKMPKKKSLKCILCSQEHPLRLCEQFLSKSTPERPGGHTRSQCKSRHTCFTCKGKHHTLLHIDNIGQTSNSNSANTLVTPIENSNSLSSYSNVITERTVHSVQTKENTIDILLATARIYIVDSKNERRLVRALIDPCSQVSLITQNLCTQLNLQSKQTYVAIQGIGESSSTTSHKSVLFTVQPYFESETAIEIEALVLPKLSSYQPPIIKGVASFDCLKTLKLADPFFAEPSHVDLLIGADVYTDLLMNQMQIIKGSNCQPMAINTKLGWLLTGKVASSKAGNSNPISLHCVCDNRQDPLISVLLEKFWRTEEIESKISFTADEQDCEALYNSTTQRTSTGRYKVRLPWKNSEIISNSLIGTSYAQALRAQKRLEANFLKDNELKIEYIKFIQEYIALGHMSLVDSEKPSETSDYFFLPHHGVWKETSSTTKLRTVFNGSCKLASGKSLNDFLHSGPNLLLNPINLIVSWRNYFIALTADIEKMFRQTEVDERDRKFQSIIWRSDPKEEMKIYLLNTVTYGLTCSPYLALRSLLQLANDYGTEYPIAAYVVRKEMYSDNVLTGAHSIQEAISKISALVAMFNKGQLNLRQWSSSNLEALSSLSKDLLLRDTVSLFSDDSSVPILGISWHPKEDYFQFHVDNSLLETNFTKRNVLSRIARTFDPLGWLSPVIIQAKILMQSLWLLKIDWDEPLPIDISTKWDKWLKELSLVSSIKIPRWSGFTSKTKCIEVHGFADASKQAYGAVVYLRLIQDSVVKVTLQVAKTRVAPIKTLSIPRLELCAAVLVVRLVKQIIDSLNLEINAIHLWTDSADVLFWLRDHPSRWNVFVANRCSEIHNTLSTAFWHHVRSKENPADVISRGLDPSKLVTYDLWWKGPSFLYENTNSWPQEPDDLNFSVHSIIHLPSYKKTFVTLHSNCSATSSRQLWDLVDKYSSLTKLLRVTAYCMRFIKKISRLFLINERGTRLKILSIFKAKCEQTEIHLSAEEIENSRLLWCYLVQTVNFEKEIQLIERQDKLPSHSSLRNLNPCIRDNLLKVGGRLRHALSSETSKHPIILPYSCPFTTLIIRHTHSLTLHGGTQLTLATIRTQYWIIRGRMEVKRVIKQCVPCARYAARSPYQLMSDLPPARVRPAPPFTKSGVDYAGPLSIRLTKTRGKGTLKGYVCIFVCMVTRAVHLEPVEDYTSESFIAAFHRFTSRRGHCKELYSDRGTNFIGADKQLCEMLMQASQFYSTVVPMIEKEGTTWKFNPPSAPHFGGLWEAAVRSLKHHMRRVIGEQILAFTELSTLLCRIEACLNSRPLTKLNDDPTDLHILTPAHFLIQRSSFIVPEPDITEIAVPIAKRWNLVSQMTQHFWKNWSSEYLSTLQSRNKWLYPQRTPKIGEIVLIRNELTPPAKWPLGLITNVHPGSDGLIRVVSVRTSMGRFRRPIVKLVPLLVNSLI